MNLKEVVDGHEISNSLKGEGLLGCYFLKKTVLHGGCSVCNFFGCESEIILMSSGKQSRVLFFLKGFKGRLVGLFSTATEG